MRKVYPEHLCLPSDTDRTEYGIYEVYYDEKDDVSNWSKEPRPIACLDIDGIKWTMDKHQEALAKPVLDHETGEEIK